jgi:hypothetical protein
MEEKERTEEETIEEDQWDHHQISVQDVTWIQA